MGPRIQKVREACVGRTPLEVRVNVSNVYEQSSDSIAIPWVDGVKETVHMWKGWSRPHAECLTNLVPRPLCNLLTIHVEVKEKSLFGLVTRQRPQFTRRKDLEFPHVRGKRATSRVKGHKLVEWPLDGSGISNIA